MSYASSSVTDKHISSNPEKHLTDWFKDAGWGVFFHYLAPVVARGTDTTVEEWNKLVDNFDVGGLAVN